MQTMNRRQIGLIGAALAISVLSGCASNPNPGDPLEKTNRWVYNFNEGLDRVALEPASKGYVKVLPRPVRTGVGNVFSNLGYGNVIVNDFLQTKWDLGWNAAGRMLTNSTVGVLGIFDVATNWGMPLHRNDFGLTLAQWGAGQGSYLVLPVLGPSSARDVPGVGVAYVTNVIFWINPPWEVAVSLAAVNIVDHRARADADIRLRTKAALDPYIFTRDAYRQYRSGRVNQQDGKAPVDQSLYDEDAGPASQPATRPQDGYAPVEQSLDKEGPGPTSRPATGPLSFRSTATDDGKQGRNSSQQERTV